MCEEGPEWPVGEEESRMSSCHSRTVVIIQQVDPFAFSMPKPIAVRAIRIIKVYGYASLFVYASTFSPSTFILAYDLTDTTVKWSKCKLLYILA